MDFLRDTIWQFIGAILAFAGIITAIWIYILQKNKKDLSYEILVSNEILTTNEELKGKIKILFNKKAIQNIHLLLIKIKNNGNVPILPADFYKELKIIFGKNTKILSAEITEHHPQSLQPEINNDGKYITIKPTLINSKDYIVLKFLLSQYDGDLRIEGRISGVKDIHLVRESTFTRYSWQLLLALVAIVVLIFGDPSTPPISISEALERIGVILVLITVVIGMAYFLTKSFEQNNKIS